MEKKCIKIGNSPSFMVGWVRSFESKQAFIAHCQNEEAYKIYASDIWDKCHQDDELKAAKKVSETISESAKQPDATAPEIKKVSTNKKATTKKE
jgi:hypothetical protein